MGQRPFIFPEPGFYAGSYENYGTYNRSVEVKDINRDGILDVVTVANHHYGGLSQKSDLSVFIGKGDGGFEKSVSFGRIEGYATYYSNMVLEDLNGDCYPDIAVISFRYGESSKLKTFFNNGDGTYMAGPTQNINYEFFGKILTGDFDRDGNKDIAISSNRSFLIFLGRGDGTFLEPLIQNLEIGSVLDAVSADFNNDGTTDIVGTLRHWDSNISEIVLLIGNGDGTFLRPKNLVLEEAESDSWSTTFLVGLTAEDLNGDGNRDILVSTSGHGDYPFGLAVLIGDGSGEFSRKPDYEFNLDIDYLPIRVKDFNGDGIPDIALQGYSKAYILVGNGNGTFKYPTGFNVMGQNDLGTGDFDNDGAEDIVTAGGEHIFTIFARGDGTFIGRKDFSATDIRDSVISTISEDFDGDNTPDLAMTVQGNWSLFSTILNRGNGFLENAFQGNNVYRVGDGPAIVKVKDLNGDGHTDIVTANELSMDVSVVLNNINGLKMAASYPLEGQPTFMAIEDLNGDGFPEIIATVKNSDSITVFVNGGDGSFQTRNTYTTGSKPSAVAVGDYNEDGRQDIAVADSSKTVSILFGNGNNTFKLQAISVFDGLTPTSITKGDFNEDGIMDLAVSGYSYSWGGSISPVILLIGKGDGTFTKKYIEGVGRPPIVMDINKDGKLDLITFSNTATVYTGSGNGQFQKGQEFGDFTGAQSVAIGDINNDGIMDILYVPNNDNASLGIWLGQGDGTFKQGTYIGGWKDVRSIEVGDIDGDGIIDIALVDYENLYIIPGSGNGVFPGEAIIPVNDQYFWGTLAAADFNGDNNQDVAVSTSLSDNNRIEVYLGTGQNTFNQGTVLTTSSIYGEGDIFTGDFNEDGRPDIILLRHFTGQEGVSVFLNKVDGNFGEAISFDTGHLEGRLVVADINNDSHLDIILNEFTYLGGFNYSRRLLIYTGKGDGTFQYNHTIPLWGDSVTDIAISDFNNDGFKDMAITRHRIYGSWSYLLSEYKLEIFTNNGDGTFGAPLTHEYNFTPVGRLFAQDFDHNGTIDLAMSTSGGFSILSGNGDGTFNKADYIYAGFPVLSEDFNLDGRPDIIGGPYISYNLLPPLRTPPSPPKKLTGIGGNGTTTLQWAANTEEDIAGYNVYRSLSAGGGYVKLNSTTVSSLTYTDTTAANGTTYYYTVSAIDKDGDESSYAQKVKAVPSPPDTTPPVIKINTPANGGTVYSPNLFVLGTINETDAKVAVNGRTGTIQKNDNTFTAYDIPLSAGENTVTVTAVDAAGNSSTDSIKVVYVPTASISGVIKSEDTGTPVQWASVYITDSEKTQNLSTGADGRYFFGKLIPGEVTIMVDSSNYDRITLSKTLSSGEALNLDILMPLTPARLSGWVYNNSNYRGIPGATVTVTDRKKTQSVTTYNWGGFDVTNIAPYDVTIIVSKPGYETYTEKRTLSNRWTNYYYYSLKPLPPSPPTGLATTSGGGYIALTWNQSLEDLEGYNIYRSTTPGSGYVKLNSYPEYYTSYKDTNVAPGTTYYYVITAVNTSNQESSYSAEASAAPRNVYSPTGLTATAGEGFVELNWSPSADSNVSSYKIYRSTESGTGYGYITTTSGTYYKDKSVAGGTTYYYVVTAVNSISKESPYSNEASATPEELKLSVSITYPKDGEWLKNSRIIVRGTVETASNEAGIVIETGDTKSGVAARYLAEVNGREFAAVVNLPEGFSYIKAIATDSSGNKLESSVMVSSMPSTETVRLTASPESGIMTLKTVTSPYPIKEGFPMPEVYTYVMDAALEVETYLPDSITSYAWDTNGDGWPEQVGTIPEITASYYSPDLYFPTVAVTDSKGTTYTATTVVNVLSRDEVDALLKGKWGSMTDSLNKGDIATALVQISSDSQNAYQTMFAVLGEQLPSITATAREFNLISITDNRAKYKLRTVENGKPYSYEVIFVKDEQGLWKIKEY